MQPTAVIDPRGVTHTFRINSLDQVVRMERASSVANPGLGFTALSYWSEMSYDRNGNLTELEVMDTGATSGSTTSAWTYDIYDQERSEVIDVGGLNLTTLYEYDRRHNLVSMREVDVDNPSSQDLSPETRWYYDDRNILRQTTRGFGSAAESTTTNKVDVNGNLTEWMGRRWRGQDPRQDRRLRPHGHGDSP